jgi:hypothetical protein
MRAQNIRHFQGLTVRACVHGWTSAEAGEAGMEGDGVARGGNASNSRGLTTVRMRRMLMCV